MISLVGILVVFGSVLGGFLMEKGKIPVLAQPSEFVTIMGAALGTVVVANPPRVLKAICAGFWGSSQLGRAQQRGSMLNL